MRYLMPLGPKGIACAVKAVSRELAHHRARAAWRVRQRADLQSCFRSPSESPNPGVARSAETTWIRAKMLSICLCRCWNSGPLSSLCSRSSALTRFPFLSKESLITRATCKQSDNANLIPLDRANS